MSRQVCTGEPVTKGIAMLEPKDASEFKSTNPATPLKKERQNVREISQSPARQSSLPTPSPRGNIDEATATLPLDHRKEELDLLKTSLCVSEDTKILVVPPTDIPSEIAEDSCTPTLDNGSKDVPSRELIPSEVPSTPSRSTEKTPSPSRSTKLGSLKEVVFSNSIYEDTSLHEQFCDAICSRPEVTNSIVSENDNKALPPSPSSPTPSSTSNSNPDIEVETEKDTILAWKRSSESSEESREGKRWDRETEPSGCQSIGIKYLEGPSLTIRASPQSPLPQSSPLRDEKPVFPLTTSLGPLMIHEDKSGRANLSEIEVNQDGVDDPSCNPNNFEIVRDVPKNGAISAVDENPISPKGASPIPTDNAEESQDAPDAPNQIDGTVRVTRSGTRFSDETNMLRDFLNRAQARKAAREVPVLATNSAPSIPLRRSPRKALAEISSNSPSPEKPRNVTKRPGTPPGKPIMESVDGEDSDEAAPETTTYRRSTRTRLFTPARPAPGAPSLIPVRRADGIDKIILQRSSAQELAIITRANTRRNRGQSKPPKLALQCLPAETTSYVAVLGPPHGDRRKSVGWDQTLVYYQAAAAGVLSGKEVKRTRARKVVGIPAGGNGTPLPPPKKEMMEALSTNGGAKRRGRSKR